MTHSLSLRHDRLVRRLGRTGWLYLAAALPWILLFVVLRTAMHSDLLVRPTDGIALVGATIACTRRHGAIQHLARQRPRQG